jgi:hypothetical protein
MIVLFCWCLATEMQFRQLIISFMISREILAVVVVQVFKGIWAKLQKKRMPEPTVYPLEESPTVGTTWQFPCCFGLWMVNITKKHT